jgi:hypothetical protein
MQGFVGPGEVGRARFLGGEGILIECCHCRMTELVPGPGLRLPANLFCVSFSCSAAY